MTSVTWAGVLGDNLLPLPKSIVPLSNTYATSPTNDVGAVLRSSPAIAIIVGDSCCSSRFAHAARLHGRRFGLECFAKYTTSATAEEPMMGEGNTSDVHQCGCDGAVRVTADLLRDSSSETSDSPLGLDYSKALIHDQGYVMMIKTGKDVSLISRTDSGLFYGLLTLLQIIHVCRLYPHLFIPPICVMDFPSLATRGLLLDISRDKVPKLETLQQLVELLASFKMNQLQLYTEHTFAYAGHNIVWESSGAMTPEEIDILDKTCWENYIELVPNQQSLAHMHRWVTKPGYTDLRESLSACASHTQIFDFAGNAGYSLCPINERVLTLLSDLYSQLIPHFQHTSQINVNLDEPFDLGVGKSREFLRSVNKSNAQMYMEYLNKIHRLLQQTRPMRIQLWADFLLSHPSEIPLVPKDSLALIWGYEEGFPFSEKCKQLGSGIPFYVCPSTCTWNSFCGRTRNSICNISEAILAGVEHGASGMLLTDWGDNGHMQPLSSSYLGYATGAAFSWNSESASHPETLDLRKLLNSLVFRDLNCVMGDIVYNLGNCYNLIQPTFPGCTVLFRAIVFNSVFPTICKRLKIPEVEASLREIEAQESRIGSLSMAAPDTLIIVQEYTWIIHILKFSCHFATALIKESVNDVRKLSTSSKQFLLPILIDCVREFEAVWLLRNKPEGLCDSVARLQHTVQLLS
ncbi:family 20 glycosylhydrolase [Pelomyxa schiedti]|nr:family 20 glycosylhydrolase [Pelomyxa schiedti]